jgi:hypothetical protein
VAKTVLRKDANTTETTGVREMPIDSLVKLEVKLREIHDFNPRQKEEPLPLIFDLKAELAEHGGRGSHTDSFTRSLNLVKTPGGIP